LETARYTSHLIPRNRYLVIIAIALLVVSLIEITDVLPLPFESSVGGAVSSSLVSVGSLVGLISKQGYASLFILMALESASFPIPSEIVLPYSGYLVSTGAMSFPLALGVSTVALLVGALVDYYLALLLGRPFVVALLRRFGVKPETIDAGERWIDQKGWWSVLLARFVPGLRSVISIPAGVVKMNLKLFVLMTLIGSVAWSTILLYVGYSAGLLWESAFASSTGALTNLILVVVAIGSGAYMVYYFYVWRARRHLPVTA